MYRGPSTQPPDSLRPDARLAVRDLKKVTPPYRPGGPVVATRQAYGAALEALARADSRVVGVHGDVGNSTFTTDIGKVGPGRLLQCDIAEQNLVGVAMGLPRQDPACFQLRLLLGARVRLHASGSDQLDQHQVGGYARWGLDRRGRCLADGIGRLGHRVRRAELHGLLSQRRDQCLAGDRTYLRSSAPLLAATPYLPYPDLRKGRCLGREG